MVFILWDTGVHPRSAGVHPRSAGVHPRPAGVHPRPADVHPCKSKARQGRYGSGVTAMRGGRVIQWALSRTFIACPVRLAAIRSARSSSSGSLRQRPKAAIAGCTSPRSIAVRRFSSWPSSAANRPESCETRSMRWSSAAPIQDRYRAFTTLDGESLACQYAGEQLGEAAFRLGNIYRLQEAFLGQILDCRYAATGRSACAQTVTQVRNNALVIMT